MAAHIFRGWEKAPEGSTHFSTYNGVFSPWLRVEQGRVYYWGNDWRPYTDYEVANRHLVGSIVRGEHPRPVAKDAKTEPSKVVGWW